MRPSSGIDPGLIEHLVGDPVADARGEGLVEQHGLHRRRPPGEEPDQGAHRRQAVEGVEAESAHRRLRPGVPAEPDAAEAPGVGPGELAALVEGHDELREPGGPAVVTAPSALGHEVDARPEGRVEPAGHAEVEDGPRPPIQLEPEVLAVAADGQDPAAHQRLPEPRRRHALVHEGVRRHVDADDPASPREPLGKPAGHLDLGELGHGESRGVRSRSGRAAARRREHGASH